MAYMNQERKKQLAPAIKNVLKKYGMKGTIAVRHHMTLVVNIKEGKLPFDAHEQVNPYYIRDHYEGDKRNFLTELLSAMRGDIWYDNSDAMIDYFDTAYYMDINVGDWNKPYTQVA